MLGYVRGFTIVSLVTCEVKGMHGIFRELRAYVVYDGRYMVESVTFVAGDSGDDSSVLFRTQVIRAIMPYQGLRCRNQPWKIRKARKGGYLGIGVDGGFA